MLAQDLEHDWHEEHEGDARAVPEKFLGEVLHDIEEVVSLVDESEDEVSVVVDQDALGSPLFGLASLKNLFRYATHVNIRNIGLPAHRENLRLVKTLKQSKDSSALDFYSTYSLVTSSTRLPPISAPFRASLVLPCVR